MGTRSRLFGGKSSGAERCAGRFGGGAGGPDWLPDGSAAAELALCIVVRQLVQRAGRGAGRVGVWSGGAGLGADLTLLRGSLSIFASILHASV